MTISEILDYVNVIKGIEKQQCVYIDRDEKDYNSGDVGLVRVLESWQK